MRSISCTFFCGKYSLFSQFYMLGADGRHLIFVVDLAWSLDRAELLELRLRDSKRCAAQERQVPKAH